MERRAVERTKARVLVACRVNGRSELAETYDISTDGCMLEASNGYCEPGDEIELTFGLTLLRGRVVWVKHRNAGVQFAARVSADTIKAIIATDELQRLPVLVIQREHFARRLQLAVYAALACSSTLLLLPR